MADGRGVSVFGQWIMSWLSVADNCVIDGKLSNPPSRACFSECSLVYCFLISFCGRHEANVMFTLFLAATTFHI